ncbi:hypothetical protein [Chryseobacterium sp.]|uniref:hypothetical protein n=1 Tax=Chryseobacterium sp. TaxID=1871047 RepID=UPI0028972E42|nr:hypothetical protein [Chryseobacterium sp.]
MGMLEGQIDLRKKKNFDHLTRKELEKRYTQLLEKHRELIMYKDDNEFFEKDLSHIINLGIQWLKDNKKGKNYHIYIKSGKSKLIKTKVEERWI